MPDTSVMQGARDDVLNQRLAEIGIGLRDAPSAGEIHKPCATHQRVTEEPIRLFTSSPPAALEQVVDQAPWIENIAAEVADAGPDAESSPKSANAPTLARTTANAI